MVAHPDVLVGKPVIKGTRISVELVMELLAAGYTTDQVLEQYDHLAREDIHACLAYAKQVAQSSDSTAHRADGHNFGWQPWKCSFDAPDIEKTLSDLVAATGRPAGQLIEEALTKYAVSRSSIIDWPQCAAVESVAGKMSGAWVLRGTRMPVATIFQNLEAGANVDDILRWYDGVDREQVKAVIDFAARSLEAPTVDR